MLEPSSDNAHQDNGHRDGDDEAGEPRDPTSPRQIQGPTHGWVSLGNPGSGILVTEVDTKPFGTSSPVRLVLPFRLIYTPNG